MDSFTPTSVRLCKEAFKDLDTIAAYLSSENGGHPTRTDIIIYAIRAAAKMAEKKMKRKSRLD